MKITRWKNLASPSTYDRSLDNFFTDRYKRMIGMEGEFIPAINTLEKKDHYEIQVAAPGMKKSDFNITVNRGILTISSDHHSEHELKEAGYLSREFSYSSFQRSFSLPEEVREEKIEASYKDGILHILLPREIQAEDKPTLKKVEVS